MAQRRRLAPTLHQKRTPAGKPPPRRRCPRRPSAAAAGSGHCPPASSDEGHCEPERRRKPRPPRRSAVPSHQSRPRNAPQRASRHHGGAARVAPARQQLAAGSARPRRLCAATSARSLRPPFRLFPRTIRPLTAYWAVNIADGSRKFARKLARPPDFVRGTWMRFGELSSLLILGSGGRRLRTRACLSVERVRLRRALPAPAKEPQVPWILHLLPPLRTTGTANPSAGASRDHRGAAPSPRPNRAPEPHPSGQAPTTGAQTASPLRGSDCARPQAACRLFGRRALRTRTQAQAATTAAQRRPLAPTSPQKRTPAGKRRPPARRPRRPSAAAAGSGHCPPASPLRGSDCAQPQAVLDELGVGG